MTNKIEKIKLINYKKFESFTIIPNSKVNILAGDNEVGKSSILEAIDIVTSGNIRKVESIGIDNLLNNNAIDKFNNGERQFKNLPKIIIELYLSGNFDDSMNGGNNTDGIVTDGIRLICEPNCDFITEINELLSEGVEYFPFDYYSVRFSTFADEGYSNYKKKIRSILIDSSNMSSNYATTDFIKRTYNLFTEDNTKERTIHKSKFRQLKIGFGIEQFRELNERVSIDNKYSFGLKSNASSTLESELMIYEENVRIDNKGTGKQVFIKTDFVLERAGDNIDIILIEEPENHLSHINLRKLIQRISKTSSGQIFITTHNSLISTRLELQNLLILSKDISEEPISLKDLSEDTSKYFIKAPVANIIEFTLSHKIVLLEGPSEYMLFEKFYELVNDKKPEEDNVSVIDIRGLSFKRYLEVSKLLKNKVAVVTDNDGDASKNCIDKYIGFSTEDHIKIFYEPRNDLSTFEKVFYESNRSLCDKLFGSSAEKYMLSNKTESAYNILKNDEMTIVVPNYIKEAIEWIKE